MENNRNEGLVDFEEYLGHVYEKANEIMSKGNNSKFKPFDIRTTFYFGISSSLINYWVALSLPQIVHWMNYNKSIGPGEGLNIKFTRDFLPDKKLIDELHLILGSSSGSDSYLNSKRLHLFIDSWGVFEDTLRSIYKEVVPQDQQEMNKQKERNKYKEGESPKVIHIDIPTIWSNLKTLAKVNSKLTNEEVKNFNKNVSFFSNARNTIHSNSFFFGGEQTLDLKGEIIKLKTDEPIDFMTIYNLLVIIDEITKTFEFISDNISHKEPIIDKGYKFYSNQ